MKLKLPPVDVYRSAFIEPIGHLSMQAARTDLAIIDLCCAVPYNGSPLQMAHDEVGPYFRNWNERTREFLATRLNLIADANLRDKAIRAVSEIDRLRSFRHRVIHDAVELGTDMNGSTFPVAVTFHKGNGERSDMRFHKVTAEQIAVLAVEIYELNQSLAAITERLLEDAPPNPTP